jgi:hypothetical protein
MPVTRLTEGVKTEVFTENGLSIGFYPPDRVKNFTDYTPMLNTIYNVLDFYDLCKAAF